MFQIHGTITLSPSFHGSHRWQLNLTDQGTSSVEAEHACSGLVQMAVDARAREEFVPGAEAIVAAPRESSHGLDGMTCSFDLKVNDASVQAAIWGLRRQRHGALWELVDGLWRLLYRDGPMQYRPYLEHVSLYFRDELPLTWLSPTDARLYSRLSSNGLEALDEALHHAPPGCTIDMSNFEGMGTILYPLFRAADERAVVRWIVNDAARRALLAAGIAESKLVQTTEGPYRTGKRCELLVTALDSLARVAIEVAALLQLDEQDAYDRLQTLPLSLGSFDTEDLPPLIERLHVAGAKLRVRS